jgi:hypothetical protein
VSGEFLNGHVNLVGRATTGPGEFIARASDNATANFLQIEMAKDVAVDAAGLW